MARRTFDLALIDGDLIAFRAASASQKQYYVAKDKDGEIVAVSKTKTPLKEGLEDQKDLVLEVLQVPDPDNYAYHKVNLQIEDVLESVGTTNCEIFLTEGKGFRKILYPTYKAHRKVHARPYHLDNCKEFLKKRWGAISHNLLEADDLLSIRQREAYDQEKDSFAGSGGVVIISYDKDLRQIPGWHYNFLKKELDFVHKKDAWYMFMTQMLTGDSADNIPGLPKYGPKKAKKILDQEGEDLIAKVQEEYKKVHKDKWREHWVANYDQLHLLSDWMEVMDVELACNTKHG